MNCNYPGIWLEVRTPNDYGPLNLIQFENGIVKNFSFSKETPVLKLQAEHTILKPIKIEEISSDRLRFYSHGKTITYYNDHEEVKESIAERDYQLILPTITNLTDDTIEQLKFNICIGHENLRIIFNTLLDSPFIQEINKRMGHEGTIIKLERYIDTLFIVIYSNKYRQNLLPVKAVDNRAITVYGFYKEPFEATGVII